MLQNHNFFLIFYGDRDFFFYNFLPFAYHGGTWANGAENGVFSFERGEDFADNYVGSRLLF